MDEGDQETSTHVMSYRRPQTCRAAPNRPCERFNGPRTLLVGRLVGRYDYPEGYRDWLPGLAVLSVMCLAGYLIITYTNRQSGAEATSQTHGAKEKESIHVRSYVDVDLP